ncbi:uncharacterized protein GO595_008352 [Histomonas meleagridis]|uniref:uncharacterized protein n=1 Tax=Histomonas meleagridis TaxID=135588 RepID=UPI00355AAC12|nr:hypothetical protein GO595_008352 [Histomonas meleagridis]
MQRNLVVVHGNTSTCISQGAPKAMRVSLKYKSGTSESELESESSLQSESETVETPNDWDYDFPYYFDEGNESTSSQAYSQELEGFYEVEAIVNFKQEEDKKGELQSLWCVCWKEVPGLQIPLNSWEPTSNLSHCRNAVAFFIALLEDRSTRKAPSLEAAISEGLFTKEEFEGYLSHNMSAILQMRDKYQRIELQEDVLVDYFRQVDEIDPNKQKPLLGQLMGAISRRWRNLSPDSRVNVYSRIEELQIGCPRGFKFALSLFQKEGRDLEKFPKPPTKDAKEILRKDPTLRPPQTMAPRPREDNENDPPRRRHKISAKLDSSNPIDREVMKDLGIPLISRKCPKNQ